MLAEFWNFFLFYYSFSIIQKYIYLKKVSIGSLVALLILMHALKCLRHVQSSHPRDRVIAIQHTSITVRVHIIHRSLSLEFWYEEGTYLTRTYSHHTITFSPPLLMVVNLPRLRGIPWFGGMIKKNSIASNNAWAREIETSRILDVYYNYIYRTLNSFTVYCMYLISKFP